MKLWEDRALIYLQYKRKLAHVSIGHFGNRYQRPWDSLVAQTVKRLPTMQETRVLLGAVGSRVLWGVSLGSPQPDSAQALRMPQLLTLVWFSTTLLDGGV